MVWASKEGKVALNLKNEQELTEDQKKVKALKSKKEIVREKCALRQERRKTDKGTLRTTNGKERGTRERWTKNVP